MKNSLETEQDIPNATAQTRREVMKKGLGLTLASSSVGLASLGATTDALAWGPWHTSYVDENLWNAIKSTSLGSYKPSFKKSRADYWANIFMGLPLALNPPRTFKFSDYQAMYIDWQNSNDAMTKRGKVYLQRIYDRQTEYDSLFGSFVVTHEMKSYGKDIKEITVNTPYSNQGVTFRATELRKLDTGDDSPFSGFIYSLFYWVVRGSSVISPPPLITTPLQLSDGSWRTYNFYNFIYEDSATSTNNLVTSGIYRTRRLSFTMQDAESDNGVMRWAPVQFEVHGFSAGGFNQNNWNSFQFLRIPDYRTNTDYDRSSPYDYSQTAQQVGGLASEFSRLDGFASDWNIARDTYYRDGIPTAAVSTTTEIALETGAAIGLTAAGLSPALQIAAQVCAACASCAAITYSITRPQQVFNASTLSLGIHSLSTLNNIISNMEVTFPVTPIENRRIGREINLAAIYLKVAKRTQPR